MMSDAVILALIASVPATIIALGTLLVAVAGLRKTANLEVKVDGRLTELLQITKDSEFAKGLKEGKDGV
jgi:hypothetical protein